MNRPTQGIETVPELARVAINLASPALVRKIASPVPKVTLKNILFVPTLLLTGLRDYVLLVSLPVEPVPSLLMSVLAVFKGTLEMVSDAFMMKI